MENKPPDKLMRLAFGLTREWFLDPKAEGMHRFKNDYPMVALAVARQLQQRKNIKDIAVCFLIACHKQAILASDNNNSNWSMSGVISDMNKLLKNKPSSNFRRKKANVNFTRKPKKSNIKITESRGELQRKNNPTSIEENLSPEQQKIIEEIKKVAPNLNSKDPLIRAVSVKIIKKLSIGIPETALINAINY